MKICYGILSSSTDGKVVSQLIRALGNSSPVFVHHDFSQRPDFSLENDVNATIIPNFISTSWGRWSQAEAILRLLNYAILNESFDYFQLLSETCLPSRPTTEFSSYLMATKPDACIGLIKICDRADDMATLNYARRYFAVNRFTRKVLGVLASHCMEPAGLTNVGARHLIDGLSLIRPANSNDVMALSLRRAFLNGFLSLIKPAHPFKVGFDCYVGSTWLCLSRETAEYVLRELERQPNIVEHYKHTLCPDESIIHTLIGNSGFKNIAGINHYLAWRDRSNGPDELTKAHIPAIKKSKRFFARKFSKSPDNEMRHEILRKCSPVDSESSECRGVVNLCSS